MKELKTYGTFNVTTEGDIEGRTTRNLGTFTGHIDEIALHLADQCCYSLCFDVVEPVSVFTPKADSVHISFGFSLSPNLIKVMRLLKDRNVTVEEGKYYKSFLIKRNLTVLEREKIEREKALKKLTEKEKRILGLID